MSSIFQQTFCIPMGRNCAPLLADLFLYSYESEFIQSLLRSDKKTIAKSFNFTYRYIDDVLSLNNPKFGDYLEVIYPAELRLRTQQSLLTQLLIWIYNSNLTFKENFTRNSMTNVMISISLLSVFLF